MTDLDVLGPDAERITERLRRLSEFHDSTLPGWSREVFSEQYRASRDWTRALFAEAGLDPRVDAAGNIIGRLPGRSGAGAALITGSHTDTVQNGGRYDGIVGVLAGVEVAQRLRETGTQLDHDLVVVDFLGEEANEFGISCLGSRAVAGTLTVDHLDRVDGTLRCAV